jgi:curli biogenesis system outer membrane secretion channel CsgG
MKTFRLFALLTLAALAACADPITAPTIHADAQAVREDGQGFMGGGTRSDAP